MRAAVVLVRDVSKRYAGSLALDGVTMSIIEGETLGLIGANGAGKTTLLRIAAGVLRPSKGVVVRNAAGRPSRVRYFGGEHTLPPQIRARDWHALWNRSAASTATTRRFGVLSRGTRQRIGLEAVLGTDDFELLLLDEPWEGLDPDASRWLSDALVRHRNRGAGILVSSHRIHDLAAICDRCEFLVGGRLAPERVICTADVPLEVRTAALFTGFDQARR
jgi:ABC-2 type transport system ATP-binding protein